MEQSQHKELSTDASEADALACLMRWRQVERLFHDALAVAPDRRRQWLEQQCSDQPDVFDEVARLLEHHALGRTKLDDPALGKTFRLPDPESLAAQSLSFLKGKQIGAYRLIDLIGAGGIGTVWLAERADQRYQKQVAVKLLKRGMDTEDVLRRFHNERQVLANLEHPYIARLIDGGATDDGLPYLVMEHVEGMPITDYCRQQQLALRDRLRLFRRVCSAVHYAHQNLVIHRDLKPSNILVNPGGIPKLLDFGIAKLLSSDRVSEATAQTELPRQLFTPEYASPEQVTGGKISISTDIYSLGIILYQLLTDQRPYQVHGHSRSQVEKAICEYEPAKPSSVVPAEHIVSARALRKDIDSITLTALRKEPSRRYLSVEQFSDDVRRYLEGLPVSAENDTLLYRLNKFVQRNTASCLAGTAVVLTLLTYIFAVLLLASIKSAALREEFLALAAEKDEMGQAWVALSKLDSAERSFRGALHTRSRMGAQQSELGVSYSNLGSVYFARHDWAQAEENYRKAYEIRKAQMPQDDLNLARSAHDLALSLHMMGRFAEAESLYREALAKWEATLSAEHEFYSSCLHNLGVLARDRNQLSQARRQLERALALRKARFGEQHLAVASTATKLADVYRRLGELESAQQLLSEAMAIQRALLAPDDHHLANTLSVQALLMQQRGDLAGAERTFRKALDIRTHSLGTDHWLTAKSRSDLADCLIEQRSFEEAESLLRTSLADFKTVFGLSHPHCQEALRRLARLCEHTGREQSADKIRGEVSALTERPQLSNQDL